EMRCQNRISQRHGITVVQHAVHFRCRIQHLLSISVCEILVPARFHDWNVRVHNHILRTGQSLDLRGAGVMVKVRMADQQDLYIAKLEAEFLHTSPNSRHRLVQSSVDQNVPLLRCDEINPQALASHEINISNDVVSGELLQVLRWGGLRGQSSLAKSENNTEQQK